MLVCFLLKHTSGHLNSKGFLRVFLMTRATQKEQAEYPQVAQARYMSSSMWTFALLRDSSDLHIYKDLYGERNKPEKKRKITVELQ